MFLKRKKTEDELDEEVAPVEPRDFLNPQSDKATNKKKNKKKKKQEESDEKLAKIDDKLTELLFNDQVDFIEPIVEDEKKTDDIDEDLPAWIDEYLDEVVIDGVKGSVYEEMNRKKFLATNPNLKWLVSNVVEDNLINTTEKLIQEQSDRVQYRYLTDANLASRGGEIKKISFHPSGNILSALDDSGVVKLFQVGSHASLIVDKYKIPKCTFANWISDTEILALAALENGFSVIDINKNEINKNRTFTKDSIMTSFDKNESIIAFATDKNSVILTSLKTKFKVGEIKMNTPATQVSFSKDGNHLYTIGNDQIYIWDIRNGNRPLSIHQDHGSLNTLSIATSNKYYATGNSSGVVNVYHLGATKPFKTLMNLVTGVDLLNFSHDESTLVFGSTQKEGSMRATKTTTWQVSAPFKDVFPTCMDVSRVKGYLAIGTEKRVRLFKEK